MPQNRSYDKCPDVSAEKWASIRKKHPHLPEIKDLTALRRETFVRLPKSLEDYCVKTIMKDPRDVIMISLILNILFTVIPLSTLLYLYPSHWLGFSIFLFKTGMWMQRFILMMHYAEHRKLFKQPYDKLGKYLLSIVMCPFIGIPPGMYRLHHVVMHHIENNVFDEDLSSTEPYQRDNFFHFLHYFAKYWSCLMMLPIYAVKKERYELALQSGLGSLIWITTIAIGLHYHYIFTLYTLMAPGIFAGFMMMFGNFSQHIFVHPDIATMPQVLKSYEFNCALSLQSINHFDNQYSFNDGYHVSHHINSRTHWTDLPYEFINNLDKYAEHKCVVFDNLGFFDVGFLVMCRRWDTLYDHYVHLGLEKRTKDEVLADLKLRLTPIHRANKIINVTPEDEDKSKHD